MAIAISRAVYAQLCAEAVAAPELEVCGILFGRADCIAAFQPCRNVAESPADSFEIDPAALIAAHKAARAGGPKVIGYYHSHPKGAAEPSARDRTHARAGELWLLIAQGALSAWTLGGQMGGGQTGDGQSGEFESVGLRVVNASDGRKMAHFLG